MATTTTIESEFTLDDPFEYRGKQVSRGKMRKIKNKDIIAINRDLAIQKLSERTSNEDSPSPITQAITNSMMTEVFCFLLSHIVTYLGDGSPENNVAMDRKVFEELTQTDMAKLIGLYGTMNKIEVGDVLKQIGGSALPAEEAASPLAM